MGFRLALACVVAALVSALSILSLTTDARAQSIDAPVRALIEAMAVGDAARIRAQFAPEATQAYGAIGVPAPPALPSPDFAAIVCTPMRAGSRFMQNPVAGAQPDCKRHPHDEPNGFGLEWTDHELANALLGGTLAVHLARKLGPD